MIFNLFPEEYDFQQHIDAFFNFKKKSFKYSYNTKLNIETLDFVKKEYQTRYGTLLSYTYESSVSYHDYLKSGRMLMQSNDEQSILLGKSLIMKCDISPLADYIAMQLLFAKIKKLETQDYIYLYINLPNIHLLKMLQSYGKDVLTS